MIDVDRFISASAGTGKTHTISKNYVDLFEQAIQKDEPLSIANVVAITFTRKAAAELKSRILKMISSRDDGNPAWQQLRSSMAFAWISTIDSFAQRILSEVGIFAEVDPDLQIGSGSIIGDILKRCISQAFFEHEELLEELLEFYTLDGITDALSKEALKKKYAMLSSRPASMVEAGLALHSDPEVSERLMLASNTFKKLFDEVYGSFLVELREENITDFTGVLITLKDILSSPKYEWIREKYSKQFRYIIVDEFQDTDSLQKEILDLLKTEENRTIYVGDAKQSIYGFRGAEVEVFSAARAEIISRKGEPQHLEINFRSHPDILEFCNAFYPLIFDSSDNPYSQIYEPVKPLPVVGVTGWRPRVKILFDPEDEAEAAALYIRSIVGQEFDFLKRIGDQDDVKLVAIRRPIEFRDIAVLLRKMKPETGKEYMRALSRHGIPYYTVGESGFFEIPEVAGILATLKVLSNPGDDLALTIALMSPVVGLDINDMAKLKYRAKTSGTRIYETMGFLHETDIAPGRIERLTRFRQALVKNLPIRTFIRPSELVEKLVEDLNYSAFLATEDSTGRKTANLRKFIITAKRLDEAGVSLRELVRMLDKVGLDDEEQASIESEETDAVKIMTVHKAKGLEFPIVIVGDTSWNQKDSKKSLLFNKDEDGICFTLNCEDDESADTFLSRLTIEERDRNFEEEKRSLYVATTRASDMLIQTFSGNKGRKSQPWKDMIEGNMLEKNEAGVEPAQGFEHLIEILLAPEEVVEPISATPPNASLETRYIEPVTSETFKEYISPTAIIEASMLGWRRDIEDYETAEDVDRDRSQALGLIAHRIMEAVGNRCRLEEVLHDGYIGVLREQIGISQDDIEKVCNYLNKLKDHPLVKEMENSSDSWNEYKITKPLDKYILYGRLDKLIRTSEGWKILDFKFSGSESYSEAHEFQMKFYLYLAREIFSPLLGAELFYLKDGISKKIELGVEKIHDFHDELEEKIAEYQLALRSVDLIT
ncbi:MAG: UvrD-helicase domain-containing protein [Methanothrix sp.]|nr:UvrD-helicase domain-containing protein [Methanothrix sp.]